MQISPSQNRRLHALLTDLKLMESKADLVIQFTEGRTTHSSEMNIEEARDLLVFLEGEKDQRTKKMRAKIIHLLCVYGMTTDEGKPDYKRINEFVKHIGSRNPDKKKLFDLTAMETHNVLCQVEVMLKRELSK